MTSRAKTWLIQGGSFLLAALLLYLALYGVDFGAMAAALRRADYRWLAPLVVVALTSHLIRAWRWKLLIASLPSAAGEEPPEKVSLEAAFSSVMIGYMINYVASRFGEVARAGNLAARERLSFSSVLGTVVAERLLDMATLALALSSLFVFLAGQFDALHDLIIAPASTRLSQLSWDVFAGSAAAVLLLALLGWWIIRRFRKQLRQLWDDRVVSTLSSFKEGFMTLRRCPRRGALLLSTAAIWTCYLFMAYLPLVILGLTGPYDLSLLDGWIIFLMGSLGIVVPSPGGTGSYHYITIETLQHLFEVARSPAATYAVLTHAAQLVLYTLVGFICLVAQGTSLQTLRRRGMKAQEAAE